MSMYSVTVPVKGEKVTFTVTEAEQLIGDLEVGISQAMQALDDLEPPVLTPEGYLTHESVRRFFRQLYAGSQLTYRAGKLFGRLVRLGPRADIKIFCRACEQQIPRDWRERDMSDRHIGHYDSFRVQMVDAASLKENGVRFMHAGYKHVGSVTISDLRTLMSCL